MVRRLAELYSYPSVLWKGRTFENEIGYLTEAISMRSVEIVAWLHLNDYSKTWEEKYLKDVILNQKRS